MLVLKAESEDWDESRSAAWNYFRVLELRHLEREQVIVALPVQFVFFNNEACFHLTPKVKWSILTWACYDPRGT